MSENVKKVLLAGDASTRKYYRISSGGVSKVLMQDEPFNEGAPCVKCNKYFKDLGVRVPEIYEVDYGKGTITQEDIGSLHLENVTDGEELSKYYDEALDIMVKYQRSAKSFDVSFTKEKFMSELIMTNDNYSFSDDKRLKAFFNDLVDRMMEQKDLLLHRDYHSRNLMIKDGKLVVIDYQDARRGPFTYDLASLIIDPYRKIDADIVKGLVSSYYDRMQDVIGISYGEYERFYKLCYLQRGIKILGTFAYQKIKKNNSNYLKYIQPSVEKIKTVLDSFPEWKDIVLGAVIK